MKKMIFTVKKVFEEHYGVELQFQWACHLPKNQVSFLTYLKNPFIHSHVLKQVFFPIFDSKRHLQALITVGPVTKADPASFKKMSHFLEATISEYIDLNQKYQQQLQRQEIIEKLQTESNKVISLNTKRNRSIGHEAQRPVSKLNITPIPLWIHGNNPKLNISIAFSIHDGSSNWAFINVQENPDLFWKDPGSWKDLPQITILIPDMESLSLSKQNHLERVLKSIKRKKKNKPLFVVTSSNKLSKNLDRFKTLFMEYQSHEKIPVSIQAQFIFHQYKKKTSTPKPKKNIYPLILKNQDQTLL